MEENTIFNNRFLLERLLGRGNFSEVWLAKDTTTDIYVALKIYAPATGMDDTGLDIFAREFTLVVNANHKNLLKPLYFDVCERKPFLVLPYCSRGSVMQKIGSMTEEEAWRLLRDVASGLSRLHSLEPPLIHQDIKPDNILISDHGDYMITDFGVSTHVKSSLRRSMSAALSSAGTIAYMAPERFSQNNSPIMANDIYSLGATVYETLTGDTPFGENGGLIQMKGAEVPDVPGDFSEDLKKVIRKCLSPHPWDRPTAEQLEKLAEDGISGRKIKLQDKSDNKKKEEGEKKTAGKKIPWVWIGAAALLVTGIVFLCVFAGRGDRHDKEEIVTETPAYSNADPTQNTIMALLEQGDSLIQVGNLQNENFEKNYIEAYNLYKQAFENSSELDNDLKTRYQSIINVKLDDATFKLNYAHDIINEAANAAKASRKKDEKLSERLETLNTFIETTKDR